jgi:NAD(P)-dependent dehydrogenase (short-subunit alcohol dehydrogenase family)
MTTVAGLAGARVLVTGASAGIGRAAAVGAVRAGARVMLAARRLDALEAAVKEAGGGAAVAVDLARPEDVSRLSAAVSATLGGLDVVISSAGVAPLKLMMDTGDEHWDQVLATNLVGTHRLLRCCVPLLGRSGSFFALSSDSVPRPRPGLGAYSVSKAALEQLIEYWRMDHPWLRFTTVTVGDTFPTEFGSAFDGDLLTGLLDEWGARGLAQARFMAPDDVAATLLAVAATLRDTPDVGIDHLTLRSPSPRAASVWEALTAASEPSASAPAAAD